MIRSDEADVLRQKKPLIGSLPVHPVAKERGFQVYRRQQP